ncbi:MAG: glutamine synthetase family protein [Clostridia bacterium]
MNTTTEEILSFIQENDIKFVKLTYCDIFGKQKNVSVMSSQLQKAFADGISFDGSNIIGFTEIENSDLYLRPDNTTLNILPWRPQQGRVARFYCNIFDGEGKPYKFDTRRILEETARKVSESNIKINVGVECEFYLFKTDELGNPTNIPFDNGQYMDMAPLDKCENIRREICITLENMNINPTTSHHESGTGQNEIDFMYGDLVESADNFMTFKTVVRTVSSRNGLYASFNPKPIADQSGSGFHINISISKDSKNIFSTENGDLSLLGKQFIAGFLNRAKEIASILNPIANSYERLGKNEAPNKIIWGNKDRSALVRIPGDKGDWTRLEIRSPDCSVNPYLTLCLIVNAGMEGIENAMRLEDFDNKNPEYLPKNLKEALEYTKNSTFVKNIFGKEFVNRYIALKEKELK